MLGKLFTKKPQARIEDVSALSPRDDRGRLLALLEQDDEALCVAALQQLDDGAVAARYWLDADTPENLRSAAGEVLTAHLSTDRDTLLKALADWPLKDQFALLRDCGGELAEHWLNEQPEAVCLDLARHASRVSDRQQAAEQLTTLESLQTLQRSARGHDKVLYRLAKTRLQNLRAAADEQSARDEALAQVKSGLEKLTQTTHDPLLEGKLAHLTQKLESLTPSEQEKALIEPLRQQVARRVYQAAAQAAEAQDKATEESAPHETDELAAREVIAQADEPLREELVKAIQAGRLPPEEYGHIQAWMDDLMSSHQDAVAEIDGAPGLNQPMTVALRRYQTVLNALHELTLDWANMDATLQAARDGDEDALEVLERLLRPLTNELDDWPDNLRQVKALLDERQSERAAEQAEAGKTVRTIRGLIRRGHGAVKAGHLRQARGVWRNIEEQLAELPNAGHDHLREEAETFHAEMEKLADWQDFAVVPKKEELIEHMRQLAERTMHPQDKADAVKALQQEWRQLSKGSGGQHQELWDQFHALAEEAFAPCRDYFAEQDELQAVNAEKRRELIDQLHQYHAANDWHNPDWAEVEKVLRLAARDWRQFSPVKPKEHRETDKAYKAAVQKIRDQLNHEYDRNKVERERIIKEAEALRDEDNVRQATEALKDLQQAWKQLGRTHRRDDQRLWQAFRAICDELFERRDAQNKAFKNELDDHLKAALAVIARIEQAADSDDPAVQNEALKALPDWENEYKACMPLPKTRYEETQNRFRQAVSDLKSARQRKQSQKTQAAWHALFERLKCLGELEAAMAQGDFDSELCKQVRAVWEDGTALPDIATRIDDRLRTTFDAFEAGSTAGEANFETLRRRTVLLEILAELDSPESDQSLRMEVQVQRLSDGLGQAVYPSAMKQALTDWLVTSVTMSESDYLTLHERAESTCLAYFSKADQ